MSVFVYFYLAGAVAGAVVVDKLDKKKEEAGAEEQV